MDERRMSPRTKTFLKGRIYFNNRQSSFSCLVRDLSATGAKLICAGAIKIPDAFDLHIPNRGETIPVRVRWRDRVGIGVSFDVANLVHQTNPGADEELTERINKLENEIASLKKILERLQANVPLYAAG